MNSSKWSWELYWHSSYRVELQFTIGPNYDTVTTSDKGIGDYDVIDKKPKPANQPPVTAEASKSDDEFYNAEEHMYAAINKKKNNVGGE